MAKNDAFSRLAAFVLEANLIILEITGPGTPNFDRFEYHEEKEAQKQIAGLIAKKDKRGLKDIETDYLLFLDDLEPTYRKIANERLYKASGIDLGGVRDRIKAEGNAIFARKAIKTADEFQVLDQYWNILKDEGDSRAPKTWAVEELLGKYAKKYDQ